MRHLIVIFVSGILLTGGATAPFAGPTAVRPPDLNQADLSGELGRKLNYLCLRQLGADCCQRLAFGRASLIR